MRVPSLVALALCVACAPPQIDLDDGDDSGIVQVADPYIEVVHPQQNSTIELDDNCDLEMVVAVQIENYELVDFVEFPTPEEGKGHWHLELTGDASYQPISSGKSQVISRTNVTPGVTAVEVTLVNSQHQPLNVGTPSAIAEFTFAAPAGVTCPL